MAYNPLATFFEEADDLIADIEQSALGLGQDAPAETVNRLFRAFHTIKGSGAMCGLDALATFTHDVEGLLDKVRTGEIPVTAQLTEVILKSTDHIKDLLRAAQSGTVPAQEAGEELIAGIENYRSSSTAQPGSKQTGERTWNIRFHPNPSLLANGGNPIALLDDLRRIGDCEVAAHTGDIPPLDEIQPDCCYLWWSIVLRAACDRNAIRDVFIFVEDDSRLEIEETGTTPAVTQARPDPSPEIGTAAVLSRAKTESKEATVRVPAERLDRLVNLVGEFVMTQSCLAQAASLAGAAELSNPVQVLERLVGELRDNVLGIRMLPIGTLFGRFRRVVHDLSTELGKEVDLVTEGAETEVDKSILDQLGEPLVHCLRNCLDHGVEPAAERIAKGKPRRASIRLAAEHTGSSVVIRIEDDGRGIDREAVRAKAIEKGLAAPDAVLSDKDVVNLILLPGFSTARAVTSVSGRGVGMDAVKRQIDMLRGSLSLDSAAGEGTRVAISLPLTLAIIDGLLVVIGGDRFIVPMAAITENVELTRAERTRNNGRNLLQVRGELIPYIDLRGVFAMAGAAPEIEKAVIVRHGEDRVGLVVDRVIGAHQTVIQPLGKFFTKVQVASGATIMGDGRVALILDVARLIHFADRRCRIGTDAPQHTGGKAGRAGDNDL